MGAGDDGIGLYVFCFARAVAAEAVVGRGLTAGAPLGAEVHEGIAAICCAVPLGEWTGEAGEAHLKDLGWVGPRALRHEELIGQLARASPVLPLRFGCIFSSMERLRDLLRRERARIEDYLDKAAGEEEWSLHGALDLTACEAAMLEADPRVARLPPSAGARYLLEQKLRKDAAQAARAWVREAEAMIARALEGLVLARNILRPTRSAERPTLEAAFHWALLVPRGAEAELSSRLEPLAEPLATHGLHLSARGPWPAYNFAPRLGGDPADGASERTLG